MKKQIRGLILAGVVLSAILFLIFILNYGGIKNNKASLSSIIQNLFFENFCYQNKYSMAFVLVENSNNPATRDDIDKMNILKRKTSETFTWAAKNLARIDTSYRIVVLRLEDNPSLEVIIKEFYKNNPDNFDFLTI